MTTYKLAEPYQVLAKGGETVIAYRDENGEWRMRPADLRSAVGRVAGAVEALNAALAPIQSSSPAPRDALDAHTDASNPSGDAK